jgi:hypothetical protein
MNITLPMKKTINTTTFTFDRLWYAFVGRNDDFPPTVTLALLL